MGVFAAGNVKEEEDENGEQDGYYITYLRGRAEKKTTDSAGREPTVVLGAT